MEETFTADDLDFSVAFNIYEFDGIGYPSPIPEEDLHGYLKLDFVQYSQKVSDDLRGLEQSVEILTSQRCTNE